MNISAEELRAYAVGLADNDAAARIEQELQSNPNGEAAVYLHRLDNRLANPWQIDWRLIVEASELPSEPAQRIRQELEILVAEIEAGRWPGLSLKDNRGLVNEIRVRLEIAEFNLAPEVFYPLSADAVRSLWVGRARRCLEIASPRRETVLDMPDDTIMTLFASALKPDRVLEMEQRLEELAAADETLKQVFHLAHFAGRTLGEIGRLMTVSLARAEHVLALARSHVLLGAKTAP
jgi:hypothetical protein